MQPPRHTRTPGRIDPAGTSLVYENLVLSDGAAGFWPLDDTGSGSAADFTGGGHTGTVTAGTLTAADGPGNRGFTSFAGTGYVSIPYWSALNTTTGPFTAEIWFRTASAPSAPPNSYGLMYRGTSDLWGMEVRATRAAEAFFRYGVSSYSEKVSGSNAWELSTWNHLVFVKAGSSGSGSLFLNGASLGTLPSPGAVVSNTSDALLLGAATTTTRRMTGDIALAAWYPVALTSGQVAAHYEAI